MTSAGASLSGVTLSAGARSRVVEHVRRDPGREACGLLMGTVSRGRVAVETTVTCENRAPPEERHRRFEIDPLRVIEAEDVHRPDGRTVVGFYHSHPDSEPRPSAEDRLHMSHWPDSVWLIVTPRKGDDRGPDLRAWTADRYLEEESVRELRIDDPCSKAGVPDEHQ